MSAEAQQLSSADDLEAFRLETRAWLEENCPPGARGPGPISNGSTKIVIEDADTRLWLERMVEKGWTVPNWPTEYGGKGLTTMQGVALAEEFARARAPMRGDFFGDTLVGPTILMWGSEEQKKEFLPGILKGQTRWCQGFSEPEAIAVLARK